MTTTDSFQVLSNKFSSPPPTHLVSSNTNPRYKNFKQTHFTAGDSEQFQKYRDKSNGQVIIPDISLLANIYKDFTPENVGWEKYKDLDCLCVDNTFNYLFHKFKKAIFVKIKDNKLDVFLPFSKHSYTNEWSSNIDFDRRRYKSMSDFIVDINHKQGYRYVTTKNVNGVAKTWYGNNCLIRTEYPIGEGDSGIPNIKDMLLTLCKERTLPDMEFFINRRDFPMITKNGTEPYTALFNGEVPLVSHLYEKYSPILSMVTSDKNSDIPMPTIEDWARVVSETSNEYFRKTALPSYRDGFQTPWEHKQPIAVWRGATTGCGTTIETNPRLKVAHLSSKGTLDKDGIPFLDAGITKWNLRPRKEIGKNYLSVIDKTKFAFDLVNRLTPEDQSSGYKYIIHVDGHVSAYRLSYELKMGCVLLIADSPYRLWFRSLLKPYVHYVPVKGDLSDLFEKIRWCKENDTQCKDIALNARMFYNSRLNREALLDYMQKLVIDMRKQTGVYFYPQRSLSTIQFDEKLKSISDSNDHLLKLHSSDKIGVWNGFSVNRRSYGTLEASRQLYFTEGSTSLLVRDGSFGTSKSKIDTFGFCSGMIAMKENIDNNNYERMNELVNEVFIGLNLNCLLKSIPNFAYMFGMVDANAEPPLRGNAEPPLRGNGNHKMVKEYVQGIILSDFIKSTQCTFLAFIEISMQLCLALTVAQQRVGFCHNDLAPWNIVIVVNQTPISQQYEIGVNNVLTYTSRYTPVMIDYGKSSIVVEGKRYGTLNDLDVSKDLLHYMTGCLSDLLRRVDINPSLLIDFASFITTFRNVYDLRQWVLINGKYESLITASILPKTPMDLFQHCENIMNTLATPPQSARESYKSPLGFDNPFIHYHFSLATTLEEQDRSFEKFYKHLTSSSLPLPIDKIQAIIILRQFYEESLTVWREWENFSIYHRIDPIPRYKLYEKTTKFIVNMYKTKYYDTLSYPERPDIGDLKDYEVNRLTDNDLLTRPLDTTVYSNEDIIDTRNILVDIVANNRDLQHESQQNVVRSVIDLDPIRLINTISKRCTLKHYAGVMRKELKDYVLKTLNV